MSDDQDKLKDAAREIAASFGTGILAVMPVVSAIDRLTRAVCLHALISDSDNGSEDNRHYYEQAERLLQSVAPVARFVRKAAKP